MNKKITESELYTILDSHELWVKDPTKGKQAILEGYFFWGYDFDRYDLSKAIFHNCDFTHCSFKKTIVNGTDFTGSTMDYAYWERVTTDENTILPEGYEIQLSGIEKVQTR